MPSKVGRDEPTIKFIFDPAHFSTTNRTVNQAAFKPSKKTKNISVYRTEGLDDAETYEIGRRYVTELRDDKKPILAGACLEAHAYYDAKLDFEPDGKPHPRHANVFGWPWEDEVQRELRIVLASRACLSLPPGSA